MMRQYALSQENQIWFRLSRPTRLDRKIAEVMFRAPGVYMPPFKVLRRCVDGEPETFRLCFQGRRLMDLREELAGHWVIHWYLPELNDRTRFHIGMFLVAHAW